MQIGAMKNHFEKEEFVSKGFGRIYKKGCLRIY